MEQQEQCTDRMTKVHARLQKWGVQKCARWQKQGYLIFADHDDLTSFLSDFDTDLPLDEGGYIDDQIYAFLGIDRTNEPEIVWLGLPHASNWCYLIEKKEEEIQSFIKELENTL